MKLVTTFHQPSSVVSSVKCRLSASDVEHLVVAKLNRLDVFSLQPESLQHECTLEIWGKVLSVHAIPVQKSHRSTVAVLLDHPDPAVLFLTYTESTPGTSALQTAKTLSLYERAPRPAEFITTLLVHPTGTLVLASVYAGKLKVIPLQAGLPKTDSDFDVNLPEINLLGLCFMPGNGDGETDEDEDTDDDVYHLGLLHVDYQQRIILLARKLSVESLELSPAPSTILPSTQLSTKVLPFPTDFSPVLIPISPISRPESLSTSEEDADSAFHGGVLVVGGRTIQLYSLASRETQEKHRGKRRRLENRKSKGKEDATAAREKEQERETKKRKARAQVEWPWGEVAAWCAIDHTRFILGDTYGRLALLCADALYTRGLVLIPLGECSPPTTLVHLSGPTLFLGSHLGNSQILSISPTPLSSPSSPTLSIPACVKGVVPSNAFDNSTETHVKVKGKGKAREVLIVDDAKMDIDGDGDGDPDDDGDEGPVRKKGCIVQTKGNYVEVVETWKNIAPIMDAVVVDVDGSGQKQIVTCSGGASSGSLNVVRNGADFRELALIPGLANVTGVWPIKEQFGAAQHKYLFISTSSSTLLFQLDNHTLTPLPPHSPKSFFPHAPSLRVANIIGRRGQGDYDETSPLVVQVTAFSVNLLEWNALMQEYTLVADWRMGAGGEGGDGEIVAVDTNPSNVVLGLSGGRVRMLRVEAKNGGWELVLALHRPLLSVREISAICCSAFNSSYYSRYIAISYWEDHTIELFHMNTIRNTLDCIHRTSRLPSLVRSILIHNFLPRGEGADTVSHDADEKEEISTTGEAVWLLAGLADGSLASCPLRNTGEKAMQRELGDIVMQSLGAAPVASMTVCAVDGRKAVFVAGSRAVAGSWERGRVRWSPVMVKDIAYVSTISTDAFCNCLVLAGANDLFIGSVKDLDKMHIRSIPMGYDVPKRIVHAPLLKAFGVASSRTEPARVGTAEVATSSLHLLDDTTFEPLSHFTCSQDEEITALMAIAPVIGDQIKSLFCVGTLMYIAEEVEPSDGRILIFTASPGAQLSLVTSKSVKGCVYALSQVNGMIVAAVNASIMLFRLTQSEQEVRHIYTLQRIAEWTHNYFVTSLAVHGNRIVVGDQVSSVSLIEVVNDSELRTVARDYGPLWPVCVEAWDEKSLIGANDALNFFSFSLNQSLNRAILERDGSYHVADLTTKFVPGAITLDMSSTTQLEPKQLFFTASGRIGVIIDIKDEVLSLQLTALQRNLAYVAKGSGSETHTKFRAPKNSRGRSDADAASFGFLDGDFLEQVLNHIAVPESRKFMDEIMAGHTEAERLELSIEDVQKVLEVLRNLH